MVAQIQHTAVVSVARYSELRGIFRGTSVGVHRNNKPYLCDKCEYRSDRNSNLMRHLLTRHGVEERGVEGEEEVDVVKVDHVVNVVKVDCEVLN